MSNDDIPAWLRDGLKIEHDPSSEQERALRRLRAFDPEVLAIIRANAARGRRVLEAAKRGGIQRRKTRPAPELLRAEVEDERQRYPKISKAEACERVGQRHGVSGRTVRRDIG